MTISQAEAIRLILLASIAILLIGLITFLYFRERQSNAKLTKAFEEMSKIRGKLIEELRQEADRLNIRQEEIIRQFSEEAVAAAQEISENHKEELKEDLHQKIEEIKKKIDEVLPPPMEK